MKMRRIINAILMVIVVVFLNTTLMTVSAKTETTNAKPTVKTPEKPKTETANPNGEAQKTEPSKSASKTTSVKFEEGKTSAEYESTIGSGETQIYLVNAQKGQYLGAQTYSDSDDDVPFTVRKKGGAELEVPEGSVKWGGDVPETGDYEIVIKEIKKTTKYKITISAE